MGAPGTGAAGAGAAGAGAAGAGAAGTAINDALRLAASRLKESGAESPRLDAELLLCFVLGVNRLSLLRESHRILSVVELSAYQELVDRRHRREPLPYLVGHKAFLSYNLLVTPGVLIPRAETELLVEVGLRFLADRPGELKRVVDVGTGSGAVAIGIASGDPGARVCATELSSAAASIARQNVALLGLNSRVDVSSGSLLDPVDRGWRASVDLIVSNPPYIPSCDLDVLQPEVAWFEPRLALDGGSDGLGVIRALVDGSLSWLAPGGMLALEVGWGQCDTVTKMLSERGYQNVATEVDLAGTGRVVSGHRADD